MSSQGPSTGPTVTSTGGGFCNGNTTPSQIPGGYVFTTRSIRDGSDWTAYKKQALVYKAVKPAQTIDPWFVHGNDYRLTYLNGKFKCDGCDANAFRFPRDVTS